MINKKFARLIGFSALLALITLTGCARISVPYLFNDPDGDGNTSGAYHFPVTRRPSHRRVFIYDPKAHAWAAYNRAGKRVNTGKASGGKLFCPDVGRPCRTVVGTFHIISKGDSRCVSSRYPITARGRGGAPMPYCMGFHPKGYAIHGTENVADYLNSHGCIGVTVKAAKWLNHHFLKYGSTVIVRPY